MKGRFRVEVPFDFYLTVTSGQSFRWGSYDGEGNFSYGRADDEGFMYAPVFGVVLGIKQEDSYIIYKASDSRVWVPHRRRYMDVEEFIRFYFSLDAPVEEIEALVQDKPEVLRAYMKYRGVRIMRQEANEILITFIFSAQNTVKNIARTVHRLSALLSHPLFFDGKKFHPFPSLEKIAGSSFELLRKNLPVRFDSRIEAAISAARHYSARDIYNLHHSVVDYGTAHETLIQLKGVGRKIADCVLLFSLEHWEAFPVDVHIRRMVERYYMEDINLPPLKSLTDRVYRMIGEYFRGRYGRWAGWVQQYLYSLSRTPEGEELSRNSISSGL